MDNGVKMSRNNGSWDNPESIVKRSLSLKAKVSVCQAMKCDSGRWSQQIHLGSPVLPDVNRKYAGVSGVAWSRNSMLPLATNSSSSATFTIGSALAEARR